MLAFSLTVASATSHDGGRMTVEDIEFIGIATYDVNFEFAGTPVGGLSGITYDATRGVYYVVSDDRSQRAPARYYEVDIQLNDNQLEDGGVTFLDVVFMRDQNGNLFPERSLDPEGIALLTPGQIFISSEGDADASPVIDPFVNRFNPSGKQNRPRTVPDKFLPDGQETWGIRDNLAFEGLTATLGRDYVVTAVENALHQDGPQASLSDSSPSRVLFYDADSKEPMAEYVYIVQPIPKDSDPPGIFADNGLSELLALDDMGTFLVMERSFAVGVGNTVRLFEITTEGATEVSGYPSLLDGPVAYDPMPSMFVADFEDDLGVVPDNLEAMTFGPPLSDGRQLLIAVSDNNFRTSQTTQFIALAVTLVPAD
jgi:hypothetical protein